MKVKVKSLSCVRLYPTLWTVACQASPAMGFPRQECWSGVPFPSPGESSQLRDWTWVFCIAGRFLAIWATRESPNLPKWLLIFMPYINMIQQNQNLIMIQMCTKYNFVFHNCPHPAPACSGSISVDSHWGGVGIILGRNTWFCQIKVIIAKKKKKKETNQSKQRRLQWRSRDNRLKRLHWIIF